MQINITIQQQQILKQAMQTLIASTSRAINTEKTLAIVEIRRALLMEQQATLNHIMTKEIPNDQPPLGKQK